MALTRNWNMDSKKSTIREYLKEKINELETNSKNKNIRDLCRGINEFKKAYRPGTDLVKDMNDELLADFHSILKKIVELFLSAIVYIWR
jgi:hypothetical protein